MSLTPEVKSLAASVLKLSKLLTKDRESLPVAYLRDPELRLAYLRYYLPSNMKKVHLALADLSLHPDWIMKKSRLRVLDLGAGPGTALLGLLAFFAQRTDSPSLSCVAVDRVSENLRIAEDLFNSYRNNKKVNATLKIVRADIESPERLAEEPFDLVVFSNVLNELWAFDEDRTARRAEVVEKTARMNLAGDGSLIIIEPALRETSRELLEVRDTLVTKKGFSVFSPCLASTRCPAVQNLKDWCHEDIPWEPPALIREIDRLTGLRKDALKFSYTVLRKDGKSLSDIFGHGSFRIVSEPLITKGKIEFFVCGRQGRKLIVRLDKDRSPQNVHFEELKRGSVVGFEGLLDEGERYRVEPQTLVVIQKQVQ